MLTPAQPVSWNMRSAASGVVTSPLPMTGCGGPACADGADAGQIDAAAETLFPGATMNEDGRDARRLPARGRGRAR